MKLRAPGPRPILLAAVRPNEGVRAWYREKLQGLITGMHHDAIKTLARIYKKKPPHALMAKDGSPAYELREAMKAFGREWLMKFKDGSHDLALHFSDEVLKHSDFALKRTLRNAGFSVQFTMTRSMNDAYQAVIGENIGLIKSIPQEYLADVEGMVMRAVQHGRSMDELTKQLGDLVSLKRKPGETDHSLLARTKRRAAFIARDQNNKATAVFNRVRKLGLGIDQSVWVHTLASKNPRVSHEAMNGETFKTAEGCLDDDMNELVQPGELPNCGCVSRGIIPGLDSETPDDAEASE